jgi:hypothetical protein
MFTAAPVPVNLEYVTTSKDSLQGQIEEPDLRETLRWYCIR